MATIMSAQEAVSKITNGSTLHVGGFYAQGTPENIIDEILKQGIRDLTIITNDTGGPSEGTGKLVEAGRVKKLICSYVGLTPIVPELVDQGKLELELVPQGTLVERIRCAGFGLGGVLTPTGLGTPVEDKKQVLELNGKRWLYDTPLKADFAIVEASRADKAGNLIFRRTQRNFNVVMATGAANAVIALVVEPIVEAGAIEPDQVMVPGVLVNMLVRKELN
jgi:acetate CoA/acetoacetate CoA-transferase alpha subunit